MTAFHRRIKIEITQLDQIDLPIGMQLALFHDVIDDILSDGKFMYLNFTLSLEAERFTTLPNSRN